MKEGFCFFLLGTLSSLPHCSRQPAGLRMPPPRRTALASRHETDICAISEHLEADTECDSLKGTESRLWCRWQPLPLCASLRTRLAFDSTWMGGTDYTPISGEQMGDPLNYFSTPFREWGETAELPFSVPGILVLFEFLSGGALSECV